MNRNFGRLFIAGFEGTKLNSDIEKKLKELNPAGIIFYDTNIESKKQVQDLISSLKVLLGKNLIVTVDQEGGKVERLRKVATSLPSLQALGRASINIGKRSALLFATEPLIDHSRVLASELSELGFNLVLAPCADLSTNPLNPIIGTRSLGAEACIVSEQLKVIIASYQDYGVKSCIKHFPGHGDTSIDSHLALPIQQHSVDQYIEHLQPFINAIHYGAEAVMTAHLISKIEDIGSSDELPASISARAIRQELRNNIKFKGIVISDEITMKALSKYGSYPELAKKMLEAGNNLVTWNTNLDDALAAAHYLNKEAAESQPLADAYDASIDLLNGYTWQTKPGTPIHDKEAKMQKIIDNAIIWSKPIDEVRSMFKQGRTAVLVYDHPKLELEMIKNMIKQDCYQFTGKESSLEFLEAYDNLLILSFQTVNNIDEDKFVTQLRNNHKWKVVQCSCDMPDEGAQIDLFGGNKTHCLSLFKALRL